MFLHIDESLYLENMHFYSFEIINASIILNPAPFRFCQYCITSAYCE